MRAAAMGGILVYEQTTVQRQTLLRVLVGVATLDLLFQMYPQESELAGKMVVSALLRRWTLPLLILVKMAERRMYGHSSLRRVAVLAIVWLSFLAGSKEKKDVTDAETDAVVETANATLTWDNVLRVPSAPAIDLSQSYTQKRAAIAVVVTIMLVGVWSRA